MMNKPIISNRMRAIHKVGKMKTMPLEAANFLIIDKFKLDSQVVAFDSYEWTDQPNPQKKEYSKKGDKTLYEGLDSAVKASDYWLFADHQSGQEYLTLSIPLLVISDEFWNFPIDHGVTGNPALTSCAQVTNLYPTRGEPTIVKRVVTAFVCAEKFLPEFIKALNEMWSGTVDRVILHKPFHQDQWPDGHL